MGAPATTLYTGRIYPGLRPFEAEETLLFFGREEQIDELLRRLEDTRFLAVVGLSGSGKSSLVRAGLLPALHRGHLTGAGSHWRVSVMRPGADPLGALAKVLDETLGKRYDRLATLRSGSLGLVDTSRHGREANENLLLVVDQFEEIFRFQDANRLRANEAAEFVELLLAATRDYEPAYRIYVVITLRSDYLGECARFQGLPEALNDSQYLVPRMTRDQLREAIQGPAALGGVDLSPDLLDELLVKTSDDPDQLPILQHLLMRMWEIRETSGARSRIGQEQYEAVGGWADALNRHADAVWNALEARRDIGKRIFQRLTEKAQAGREVRRPVNVSELAEVAVVAADQVKDIVEHFRQEGCNFLTSPHRKLTDDSVIDISHESLIRHWKSLNEWATEETDWGEWYRRLEDRIRIGVRYVVDPELESALQAREKGRWNEAWAERYATEKEGVKLAYAEVIRFLEQSKKRRSDELARLRRTRVLVALAAVLFAVLFDVASYLWLSVSEARQQSAMKDVRSAEEAVGKWSFESQAAGFSGSIALVLRKNQTFTLTIDSKQNGVATQSVRDGAWAWNETTRAVHLSGDAPPVELGSFERVLRLFSNGSAALVFLVAMVLSFGASIYLLRRYRAAVQRLMRGLAETGPPPETLGVPAAVSSRPPITVTTIAPEEAPVAYAPIRRGHFRTMAVYAAAGTCQAVFAASLWIKATGQPLEFGKTVILILVYLWPVLLSELMLWGRARLAQILSTAGYLMVLMGAATLSSTPPMMVAGVRMSAAGQVLFLWAGIMLVPTLAVWAFLRRPVRAAGPLTFTFSLILLFGVLCGMAVLEGDFGDSRFGGMLTKIHVNSWVLILGVPLLGGLCFAPIGWFTGRLIGRLYDRKKINDQTITIDALWLTFSMVEGLDFVIESGTFLGILQVLILFALYRGVFILLTSWKYGPENYRLLLLRVFRGDRGSDRLMENFGTRWRYCGSIQLIGGPDLATANVQPNQFLDFLRRRLADYFIKDSGSLTRRLNQLDFSRDADSRFRVNEMLCQGEVWKETVQHVVGISDAVLMDLRGFSRDNRGCRFELRVLFETVALDRIVLLTDHRSVGPDLDQAIAEAWQATTLQGPNGKTAAPVVRVMQLRRITSKSSAALCHALLSGIAVSRVSTTAA